MSRTDASTAIHKPYRRIYLGGTFDCLHRGHLSLFRNARRVALEVAVGVNTDEFAERYKRRPLMALDDRLEVLTECRLVDLVVVNTGCEDSKPAILACNVDAIGHGDDWTGPALMSQMSLTELWLATHGIDMVYLPYTRGVSTTSILNRAWGRK